MFTLPARHFTDPVLFQAEIERHFAKGWVCVGREGDISDPGDFRQVELLGESLLLVRGDDQVSRAFFNVCRHRGTQLCEEPLGRFAGRIQCPYHAWTYGLDGRLLGAPHMADTVGFDAGHYPLYSVACSVWDGHVFVNLSNSAAPLLSQLRDLPEKFAPWSMSRLRRVHEIVYDVRANWKLILQNYSECLHCPFVHPALQNLSHYLSGENEPANSAYVGGRMTLRPGIATLTMDGTSSGRGCLPGLTDQDRRHVSFYAVLPNLLLSLHPDYMLTHTLWPRSCDRTTIVCQWHVAPEELTRPGFTIQDAVDFWDLTNRQDWHVSELTQRGVQSRSYTPGPYSTRERLLHEFDLIVTETPNADPEAGGSLESGPGRPGE